jgi:hypothetical protein
MASLGRDDARRRSVHRGKEANVRSGILFLPRADARQASFRPEALASRAPGGEVSASSGKTPATGPPRIRRGCGRSSLLAERPNSSTVAPAHIR